MSSMSSSGVASFSGLGVGWSDCVRGTLLKNEVMDLCIALGFAGDLAGDFWLDTAVGFGDATRRVCVREGFDSPSGPLVTLNRVPLLGRARGGGESGASSSSSSEITTGCFRAALGLPIPPRFG